MTTTLHNLALFISTWDTYICIFTTTPDQLQITVDINLRT